MTGDPRPTSGPRPHRDDRAKHGGHVWMMIACCIPMLAIAIALVASGVVSPGLLVVALACTAMMALMMGGMRSAGRSADPSADADHDPDRR